MVEAEGLVVVVEEDTEVWEDVPVVSEHQDHLELGQPGEGLHLEGQDPDLQLVAMEWDHNPHMGGCQAMVDTEGQIPPKVPFMDVAPALHAKEKAEVGAAVASGVLGDRPQGTNHVLSVHAACG